MFLDHKNGGNLMKNTFNESIIVPCLYSCANIITEVNKGFLDLTEYKSDELKGKSLHEIGDILKFNSQIFLDKINNKYSGYIFTKSLNAIEVDISVLHDDKTNTKVYTFVEVPNSRLDDKLIFVEQMFIDNISGVAIYSVPGLILLKANQIYLDFTYSRYNKKENSIGKPISEVITGFAGTRAEVVCNNVLTSQKASYIKKFKFKNISKGITYWDSTQTPIFDNGKMKYIFHVAIDVTKDVLKNQNIERQNRIIKKQNEVAGIIENISDGISIFDNKGKYLIFNKSARKIFFPFCETIDTTSYGYKQPKLYDMLGEKIDLENIPSHRVRRGEKFENMRVTVSSPAKTLEIAVSGTPIYDDFGEFSLGVVCSRDMTEYCKREESIRSRFEILNKVIDTFDLPVLRLSCPDFKIIDTNKKALNIFKLVRPNSMLCNIKNNTIKDLFGISKTIEYYRCLSEVVKEKETKYLNKVHYVLNGDELYFNIIFEPVLEINGKIKELLILAIDITPEIRSNIAMKKALKLQGEFLVNISHELKTPLNVIFSTAQLFGVYCKNESLDDNKNSIIKYIDSIKQNSYRLSKMINNIVDLSKIEAGFFKLNLSNNNIVKFVEDIVMSVT